ncbi:MAG: DUF6745 domain-containing protein [Waterburya sp.]
MGQKIGKITLEQENLISVYQEKWWQIGISTEQINHLKITEAVKLAYALIGLKQPEIFVFDSPYKALKALLFQFNNKIKNGLGAQLETQLWNKQENKIKEQLEIQLWRRLWQQLWSQLDNKLVEQIDNKLWGELNDFLENQLGNKLWEQLNDLLWIQHKLNAQTKFEPSIELIYNCISSKVWAAYGCYSDFCISILNCEFYLKEWEVFQSLIKYCGWIFPYENVCIVSAHPHIMSLDHQKYLHSQGSPAIKFGDGFSIYANHGEIIGIKS